MSAVFLAAALAAAQPAPAAPPAIPEGEALAEAVAARSAALFALAFEGCDPDAFRAFAADDLEFYHDVDGVVARSGDEFAAGYARSCAARREPGAWRNRRELVADGYAVHPVPGYGAIEEGEHLFYERHGEGRERLVGRARFVHLWRLGEDGQWRIARVLSFAHGPAGR